MDIGIPALVVAAAATFLTSILVHPLVIRLAHQLGWVDFPRFRHRHVVPTPSVGGVAIFLAVFVGMTVFALLDIEWARYYRDSALVVGLGVAILMVIGLIDDVRGLGPYAKLFWQFVAAVAVVSMEPNIKNLLGHWSASAGWIVWPLAVIWIMTVTNSLNLIDGLDGLAGGTSFLVLGSMLILSIWAGNYAGFAVVISSLVLCGLAPFLWHNWHPAKLFLGDNGSLTIGFVIASVSMMGKAPSKSWILLASMILMMGYPILDLATVVFRRYRKGLKLFKGDRYHLHFRILRLGLTVRETAVLLLSIGLYLQISAIIINLMSPPSAAMGITVIAFSIFSLLFLIVAIENWRVRRVFQANKNMMLASSGKVVAREIKSVVMNIDLEPIIEGMAKRSPEESKRILDALELMLRSCLREEDDLVISINQAVIRFKEFLVTADGLNELKDRFKQKIRDFVGIYNLECSSSEVPIRFEERSLLIPLDTQEREDKKAA